VDEEEREALKEDDEPDVSEGGSSQDKYESDFINDGKDEHPPAKKGTAKTSGEVAPIIEP
jgi:hypothetical protein